MRGFWAAMTSSKCPLTKKVRLTKAMRSSTWRTHNKWPNSALSSTSTNGRMLVRARCAWSHTRAYRARRSCATVSRTKRSSVTNCLSRTFTHAAWWKSTTRSCPWLQKHHGGTTKLSPTSNVRVICQSQGYYNINAIKLAINNKGLTRYGPRYSTWSKKNL